MTALHFQSVHKDRFFQTNAASLSSWSWLNDGGICGNVMVSSSCSLFTFQQDTLEKEGREGIHRAMYSLLSWVLEQRRSTIQIFWSNLLKDYNQDSYPKLKTLLSNLQSSTLHTTLTHLDFWGMESLSNCIYEGAIRSQKCLLKKKNIQAIMPAMQK